MLRVALVGGAFFVSLPFMVALQWLQATLRSPFWGPASVAYYRFLRSILRINVHVRGELVRGRPVLIVANHVSWVDIVVLASIAPMVFVAKREVSTWPLIGAAAKVQKVVFVDRVRRQQTGATVSEIGQRLAEGHPVVLFAEGTSSDGNRVLPFRSALIGGAEAACREAGLGEVTLQPMAMTYVSQNGVPMGRGKRPLVAWYGDLDFFPHMAAFMRGGIVDAVVSFGAPVAAGAEADRKSVAKSLETQVRAMLTGVLRGRGEAA
ncbi:MAG: 1-acyl-sn-glycerol-3-phosphate acyltransferase [Pseudolabrys sp.]|nr:1-acyl-sn-glycerol-3-phosphate acyltransferase [Pseudolabrys sp.]